MFLDRPQTLFKQVKSREFAQGNNVRVVAGVPIKTIMTQSLNAEDEPTAQFIPKRIFIGDIAHPKDDLVVEFINMEQFRSSKEFP